MSRFIHKPEILTLQANRPNYFNGVSLSVKPGLNDSVQLTLSDDESTVHLNLLKGDPIYLNDGTWILDEISWGSFDAPLTWRSSVPPAVTFTKFEKN